MVGCLGEDDHDYGQGLGFRVILSVHRIGGDVGFRVVGLDTHEPLA